MAVLTISQEWGSGGTAIAARVGEVLGLPVADREIIMKAAAAYGIQETKLEEVADKAPTLWERIDEEKRRYSIYVREAVYDLAREGRADGRISLMVADASHLPFTDGSFEACFDFGALHHIPAWRRAVAEVARVLKPGGVFAGEELFLHPPFTRFFPGTTIPGAGELLRAFEAAGLELTRHQGLGPGFSIFQARKALL